MADKPLLDDLDIQELPPDFEVAGSNGRAFTGTARPARAATSAKKPSKPAPPYKEGMFVEPLTKAYGLMALVLLPFKPNSAIAVAENAEQCAEAWDQWARTSPAIRKLLAPLLNSSGVAQVAIAHAPIGAAVVGELAPRYADVMMQLGARLGRAFNRQQSTDDQS